MLKINLSGDSEHEDKSDNSGEGEVNTSEDTMVETPSPGESEEEEQEVKSHGSKGYILVLLAVIAIAALVYFQKDTIMGLFAGKQEVVQQPPAPPPPSPEPEVVLAEPDPTFVALNGISEVVPPRLWLSSTVIMYDGSYEIKGIAFSHETFASLISSLKRMGKISSQNIPKKLKSTETVYNFTISGGLNDIAIPEILDIIPPDKLVTLADKVKGRSKEFGIKFIRFPESSKKYTEKDLPFGVEGSYKGLQQVIGELCPEGSDIKVYRLTISPSSPGRAFDSITANFSLRIAPSI